MDKELLFAELQHCDKKILGFLQKYGDMLTISKIPEAVWYFSRGEEIRNILGEEEIERLFSAQFI